MKSGWGVFRFVSLTVLMAGGLLIVTNKVKAATCTGPGWNCWEYNWANVCVDLGLDKSCELNSGGTACFYNSTGCCAESGQSCTYSGGGGGGCSPISCGTQTCDCNTQQCCSCGCKAIGSDCNAECGGGGPTNTPGPTSSPTSALPRGWHDSANGAACMIGGWTCDQDNYATALEFDVYEGATKVNTTPLIANVANEQAVSDACGGTGNHRFYYVLPSRFNDGLSHNITVTPLGVNSSGVKDGYNGGLLGNPRSIVCPVPTPLPYTCANFVSGSVTPNSVVPGAPVTVRCDWGKQLGCLSPGGGLTGCVYNTFEGTTAVFTCNAPVTPGVKTNYCNIWNLPSTPECAVGAAGLSCADGSYTVVDQIPNCSNVTTSSSMINLGQSVNLSANYRSDAGNLAGEIFQGTAPTINRLVLQSLGGTTGTINHTWTPTAAGVYPVCCRAWNDSIAECRPAGYGSIAPPVYTCAGPGVCASLPVTVCPNPMPVPSVTNPAPACGATSANLSWSATAPVPMTYALRVNDRANGWVADCSLPQLPGDVCLNSLASTNRTISVTPGHTYDWWVHSCCGNNCSTQANGVFTVPQPASCSVSLNCPASVSQNGSISCTSSVTPVGSSSVLVTRGDYSVTGTGTGVAPASQIFSPARSATSLAPATLGPLMVSAGLTTPLGVPFTVRSQATVTDSTGSCAPVTCSATDSVQVACPASLPAPVIVNPAPACGSASTNLSWGAVPGATRYALRVDDMTANAWAGCPSVNPGDICNDNVLGTSSPLALVAGHQYHWWVHACCSGTCGVQSEGTFTVPLPPSCSVSLNCPPQVAQNTSVVCTGRVFPAGSSTSILVTGPQTGSLSGPGAVGSSISFTPKTFTGNLATMPSPQSLNPMTVGAGWSTPVGSSVTVNAGAQATDPTGVCTPVACTGSTFMTVVSGGTAWFSTGGGGGVWAGGGAVSPNLPNASAPVPTPVFIKDGAGGVPGVAMGSSVIPGGTGIISSRGWVAGGSWPDQISRRSSSYQLMKERVEARVALLYATVPQPVANSGEIKTYAAVATVPRLGDNVAIMKAAGPLTLSALSLSAGERALVFVDGNVTIDGEINVAAGGFFGVFASGNITVADTVGYFTDTNLYTASPNLTGIYFAQGFFNTGNGDSQLRINGTIVGMGGVILGRDHLSPDSPAEYVEFQPSLTYLLSKIGLRKLVWRELVAP